MLDGHWTFGKIFSDYLAEVFPSFTAGFALHIPGGHRLFDMIFGDYADEVLIATVVGMGASFFFTQKPYRKWKLYKKIRRENAQKTLEDELLFPPGPPSDAFPDLPPEESEEE